MLYNVDNLLRHNLIWTKLNWNLNRKERRSYGTTHESDWYGSYLIVRDLTGWLEHQQGDCKVVSQLCF
jgi:hypothetical protein